MKEYKGKSNAVLGLGIAVGILAAIVLGTLIIVGVTWVTILISAFLLFIISFLLIIKSSD